MVSATSEQVLKEKYAGLERELDERGRRVWAATEARALGRGGPVAVARATGLSMPTIRKGLKELAEAPRAGEPARRRLDRRSRREGGGRKRESETDATLVEALERLVDPTTRGDPMSPLRWTCKSTRKIAGELTLAGHKVSHMTVARLLCDLDYSLQAPRKTLEGSDHPDRDDQFQHISETVKAFQRRGQPVVSVDAKKKEHVGNFANGGREYQPKRTPERVRVYDFIDPKLGKVTPYGVYDVSGNVGWVSVGTDHDTSEFAVESLRRWWRSMGKATYPTATELLVTADGGGSNGSRVRLWKASLQRLADETGLAITVRHFPPGTSKWNKIEHRMFAQITKNWRGRPLISHEVIVNLIANTTTESGLTIDGELDTSEYPKGIKVSDEQMAALNLERDEFHGDWNYTIRPREP